MYTIYIDESGDKGLKRLGSRTDAYALSAVVIHENEWLSTLDQIVGFRRFIRDNFGIRMRDEIKAGYLIHGTGPFLNVSESSRMKIFKMALRLQEKMGSIKTWAIIINKVNYDKKYPQGTQAEVQERVWQYMIQRLERLTTKSKQTAVIFPDEGNHDYVTKMFRKMRRHSFVWSYYNSGQSKARPAEFVLEDPNFRKSDVSYFVQLADLNAYAAVRHIFPQSYFGGTYWNYLGNSRLAEVNQTRGGPPGIVVWP